MEKDLEEKYPHKVVSAIHKGKVIPIGDTYDEVMKKPFFQKESFTKEILYFVYKN